MKKIVYLIQHTCNSGGMERVLCNKTNWLVSHGYDVHIVTTDQKNRKSFFEFDPKIKHTDLGINYEDNNGKGFLAKTISYLFKQNIHRKTLTNLLTQVNPDIVVSMFGTEVGFLWKIKDGSKKVAEIHFSKFFRLQLERKGLLGLADRWRAHQDEKYIKKYDRFVVLTHEDKQHWQDNGNIEVIHNAVSFIPTQKAQLEAKRVLAVGRLSHQKGMDMLIQSWALVAKKHSDWKLSIFGSGEELDNLKQQIQNLEITNSVEINSPTQNVMGEFLNSSIYMLSSRYEGLPMVLIEAMSCGLPAVSFACKCGPKDVIDNDVDGILIEPYKIERLANGVCELIENPIKRKELGKNAIKKIEAKFSEEIIMQQWVDLFYNISSKK